MAPGTTKTSRGVIWVLPVTRITMPCLSRRVDQSLEPKRVREGLVFRLVRTGACAGWTTDSAICRIILLPMHPWRDPKVVPFQDNS